MVKQSNLKEEKNAGLDINNGADSIESAPTINPTEEKVPADGEITDPVEELPTDEEKADLEGEVIGNELEDAEQVFVTILSNYIIDGIPHDKGESILVSKAEAEILVRNRIAE